MMSVPADSQRKIGKALANGVDFVFLDLEEGIASQREPEDRDSTANVFKIWTGETRSGILE